MSKKITQEDLEKWNSLNVGSIVKNFTKEGTPYSQVVFNDNVDIVVDGIKITAPGKKHIANLFKKEEKHPNLLAAEEKYNFEIVRDVSLKLKNKEKSEF